MNAPQAVHRSHAAVVRLDRLESSFHHREDQRIAFRFGLKMAVLTVVMIVVDAGIVIAVVRWVS